MSGWAPEHKEAPPEAGPLFFVAWRLVGGRKDLGLEQLHGDATAVDVALPRLDTEDLRAADLTLKPLP